MSTKQYFYTTRDLLIMAALASLGGITSTYVNALGDMFQSVLGFAGTTQWAAGLHVLWLILAAGIVRKPGTGTITGVLKGLVELLTGNTHGLLVVLVDLVAGILVDVGLLPFGKKRNVVSYSLAGGISAASNVIVFQLFASLPADLIAYGALGLIGLVAFVSGVIFAGVLGWALMNALRQAGVIKQEPQLESTKRPTLIFLVGAIFIAILLTIFLRGALKGPVTISIGGTVQAPYEFPAEHGDISEIEAEGTMRGTTMTYKGYPVKDLLYAASPTSDQGWVLIQGSDGYTFFISMSEVRDNPALLLAPQGEEDERSYNLVGAKNSKAWVRGVHAILAVNPPELEIIGLLDNPGVYDPDKWQFEMDSTFLEIGEVTGKYQGTVLGAILQDMGLQESASEVILVGSGDEQSLTLSTVLDDSDIRIFTIIMGEQISYAVATMDGQVIVTDLDQIEVR